MILRVYYYLKIKMKLDEIIVLLYFEEGKRDFLKFKNKNKCERFFKNENNIKNLEERKLVKYEVYYGMLATTYKE